MATRKIEVAILGDASSLQRAFGKAGQSGSRFGRAMGGFAKTGVTALVAFGVAAGAAGIKAVGLASDAEEVASKMGVVFGKQLPGLNRELDAFAAATGASRYELRQQAADMGALLGPMLGSKKAAADMSAQTVKLATDLGSFNNVPTADALEAIRAGLVGETEPLRKFGVLINEAAIQEEAYRAGIAKRGAELTEQQKVQARYNLIMRQTKQAQGDAERTSGSMANQIKRLRNSLTDTATEIGRALLPAALKLVTWVNANLPSMLATGRRVFAGLSNVWRSQLRPALSAIGVAIGAVAAAARRYWPVVRDAAVAVVRWYQSNLAPTISAVIGFVRGLWQRFGADILRVARQAFGVVSTIVGTAMRNVKAVIELVLAVIRGDWGAAWNALKTIVSNTVRGFLAILRGLAPLAGNLARLAGRAIAAGIQAGLALLGRLAASIVSRLAGAISTAASWALSAAADIGRRIVTGILNGLGGLASALKSKLEGTLRSTLSSLNPFSPVEHGGEVYIGKPIVEGAAKGVTRAAGKLKAALSATVVQAVRDAKQNLTGLTGQLAGSIGQGIDARASRDIGALAGTPEGQRLAQLEAEIKADEQARERARLTREQAEAKTDEERADAAQALADFERNLEVERLRESLAAQEDAIRQSAEDRKTALDKGVADLTDALNRGQITMAEFQSRMLALFQQSGPEWQQLGDLLGSSFANGFRDQLEAVWRQAGLIGSGPQAPGQSGAEPDTRDPFAVQLDEWKQREKELDAALDKARKRLAKAQAAAKKDGATAKERAELADANAAETRAEKLLAAHRRNRPKRLALGGIVTGPTRALIGERGPEAVVPLTSRNGLRALEALGLGGAGRATVNVEKLVVRRDADIDAIAAGLSRRIAMGV